MAKLKLRQCIKMPPLNRELLKSCLCHHPPKQLAVCNLLRLELTFS